MPRRRKHLGTTIGHSSTMRSLRAIDTQEKTGCRLVRNAASTSMARPTETPENLSIGDAASTQV